MAIRQQTAKGGNTQEGRHGRHSVCWDFFGWDSTQNIISHTFDFFFLLFPPYPFLIFPQQPLGCKCVWGVPVLAALEATEKVVTSYLFTTHPFLRITAGVSPLCQGRDCRAHAFLPLRFFPGFLGLGPARERTERRINIGGTQSKIIRVCLG